MFKQMYPLENWIKLSMCLVSTRDSLDSCFNSPKIFIIIPRNIVEGRLYSRLRRFDVGTKFDSNCGSNQRSLVELSCFAFLQFDIFQ